MFVKKILKSVLPVAALNAVRQSMGANKLNAVPLLRFDERHLRPVSQIDLKHLLDPRNPELNTRWQNDQRLITDTFGDMHKWGGVNPGDRRALYYLLAGLKPVDVLEVGTHIGASTLYIAKALKSAGVAATVTTVDILDVNAAQAPWSELGLKMPPARYMQAAQVGEMVDFRIGDSVNVLEKTDKQYDFIFLDGDHSPQTVYREMSAALSRLKPDGVILLHDYYPRGRALYKDGTVIYGPFSALDRIMKENSSIQVTPLGELPWPTKQESSVTSLALVSRRA